MRDEPEPRPVDPADEVTDDAGRVWVEFDDPADPAQRFRCDLTWLTSSYRCVFGAGCHGIDADAPDAGCCTLGAHFTDEADVARVSAFLDELGDDEWEHRDTGIASGWTELDDGETKTRIVDGACILLNRAGFPAGAGCALHQGAVARGLEPLTVKPDVCWQLPLRRTYRTVEENDGTTYLECSIGEYRRGDWGPGGHDFDWYCTASPLAHGAGLARGARTALFHSSEAELRELLGGPGYDELARRCEAHLAGVAAVISTTPTSTAPPTTSTRTASPDGRALLPLLVHPATLAAGAPAADGVDGRSPGPGWATEDSGARSERPGA